MTRVLALWRTFYRLQLSYRLMIMGSALASVLPLSVNYAVADVVGDIMFLLLPIKRRATIGNFRVVLGPNASRLRIWRCARRSFRNYMRYGADFMRFASLDDDEVQAYVEYEGKELLEEQLAHGKGVLMVGMHFGYFDWAGAHLALEGYPVSAVADTLKPPKLNDLIQEQREDRGITVIPVEKAGRGVLGALRRGDVLGLLIDRPVPGKGVMVEFMGRPIEIPAGAATLSLRTGAPIMPAYMVRIGLNKFRGAILPAVQYQPSGDHRTDVQRLTQGTMRALEPSVHSYPEQWYMFRRMWHKQTAFEQTD